MYVDLGAKVWAAMEEGTPRWVLAHLIHTEYCGSTWECVRQTAGGVEPRIRCAGEALCLQVTYP